MRRRSSVIYGVHSTSGMLSFGKLQSQHKAVKIVKSLCRVKVRSIIVFERHAAWSRANTT